MRRCTKSASPATRLQKITTTFSLATRLRLELNDAQILGGINFGCRNRGAAAKWLRRAGGALARTQILKQKEGPFGRLSQIPCENPSRAAPCRLNGTD